MVSRKLRHYFQAHEITVVTRLPLRRILRNPEATGSIVEWALELSSFGLKFESTSTIQSRALVQFIAEWTPTTDEEVDMIMLMSMQVEMDRQVEYILNFKGSIKGRRVINGIGIAYFSVDILKDMVVY